jgi:hypothetical protein
VAYCGGSTTNSHTRGIGVGISALRRRMPTCVPPQSGSDSLRSTRHATPYPKFML